MFKLIKRAVRAVTMSTAEIDRFQTDRNRKLLTKEYEEAGGTTGNKRFPFVVSDLGSYQRAFVNGLPRRKPPSN